MERLTKDDVKQMGMVELSHNQVFVKDQEAWYRDFEREVSVKDLVKEILCKNEIPHPEDNEEFGEYMFDLLQDGYETVEGMIAMYYNALWAFAEVREVLKAYEDTGLEPEEVKAIYAASSNIIKFVMDKKELVDKLQNELKKYDDLEEQGFLINFPYRVGETIYHKNDNTKIPYTMHCINKIVIDDDIKFFYTDVHFFRIAEVGKTVFRTREEAEKALEKQNE